MTAPSGPDVVLGEDDLECFLVEAKPDWGSQRASVFPVGGENGGRRSVDQRLNVVERHSTTLGARPSDVIPEHRRTRYALTTQAVRVLPVDGLPGVPGDLEDHSGDRETDQRIRDRCAERDDCRAGDDAERDEGIDARVVPIGDQGGTVKAFPAAQPDSRGDLVSDEPDDARGREHPKVTQVLRVEESLDRLVEGHERADQDRGDDSEPGPTLAAR